MKDLIEALTIFTKYLEDPNGHCPTHCEHDVLHIADVCGAEVSAADLQRLDELGFFLDEESDTFQSFRFGSA